MMTSVGIDPEAFDRRPFEFSGGQCQRIQIARIGQCVHVDDIIVGMGGEHIMNKIASDKSGTAGDKYFSFFSQ